MARREKWTDKLGKQLLPALVTGEGKPLVEVYGFCRVLIEYHNGVLRYDPQQIQVKIPGGTVEITGTGLTLARVAREQLVIRGQICGIRFCRRDG